MIVSFRSKALKQFFEDDDPSGIRPDLVERVRARLQGLHRAKTLSDLNVPGWRCHRLHDVPPRYAIAVNGPWRVTFEWGDGSASRVDLEQYH
ncbi:MAG: type II toxin-antitoxin system RelE/ParE family toxin [Rhodospirillaceae bacterium]|nr:type II toxin-antitoxin system RelE/ParE family toxin [Rhodospirillaceae bacterium]